MKGVFILSIIYLLTFSVAKGQLTDTVINRSYNLYLTKRATNLTAGWILLGAGLIISAGSYLAYVNNGFNGVWKQEDLFYLGGVTSIASIPFFITAGKNKRKASLALKGESVTTGKQIFRGEYPAISFAISLQVWRRAKQHFTW